MAHRTQLLPLHGDAAYGIPQQHQHHPSSSSSYSSSSSSSSYPSSEASASTGGLVNHNTSNPHLDRDAPRCTTTLWLHQSPHPHPHAIPKTAASSPVACLCVGEGRFFVGTRDGSIKEYSIPPQPIPIASSSASSASTTTAASSPILTSILASPPMPSDIHPSTSSHHHPSSSSSSVGPNKRIGITSLCSTGSLLFSACEDGIISIWDISSPSYFGANTDHNNSYRTDEGAVAGVSGRGGLYKRIRTIRGHDGGYVTALCVSAEGTLYSGGADRVINGWDPSSGRRTWVLTGHTRWILSLTVANNRLYSSSSDNTIRIWDTKTGRNLHILDSHSDWVYSLCLGRDLLYSASRDGNVRVWDINSGKCLRVLEGGHGGRSVRAVCVAAGRLYSAGDDCSIVEWDVKNGIPVKRFGDHLGAVACLQAGYDGKLYSGSGDATIKIWDIVSYLQNPTGAHTSLLSNTNANASKLLSSSPISPPLTPSIPARGASLSTTPSTTATSDQRRTLDRLSSQQKDRLPRLHRTSSSTFLESTPSKKSSSITSSPSSSITSSASSSHRTTSQHPDNQNAHELHDRLERATTLLTRQTKLKHRLSSDLIAARTEIATLKSQLAELATLKAIKETESYQSYSVGGNDSDATNNSNSKKQRLGAKRYSQPQPHLLSFHHQQEQEQDPDDTTVESPKVMSRVKEELGAAKELLIVYRGELAVTQEAHLTALDFILKKSDDNFLDIELELASMKHLMTSPWTPLDHLKKIQNQSTPYRSVKRVWDLDPEWDSDVEPDEDLRWWDCSEPYKGKLGSGVMEREERITKKIENVKRRSGIYFVSPTSASAQFSSLSTATHILDDPIVWSGPVKATPTSTHPLQWNDPTSSSSTSLPTIDDEDLSSALWTGPVRHASSPAQSSIFLDPAKHPENQMRRSRTTRQPNYIAPSSQRDGERDTFDAWGDFGTGADKRGRGSLSEETTPVGQMGSWLKPLQNWVESIAVGGGVSEPIITSSSSSSSSEFLRSISQTDGINDQHVDEEEKRKARERMSIKERDEEMRKRVAAALNGKQFDDDISSSGGCDNNVHQRDEGEHETDGVAYMNNSYESHARRSVVKKVEGSVSSSLGSVVSDTSPRLKKMTSMLFESFANSSLFKNWNN